MSRRSFSGVKAIGMMINTNTRSNQVKEHLLEHISRNHMVQGDQLPSEAELAKTVGVSRNTIREAYIALEAEGIIVRRHGIGTFVVRNPMITDPLAGEVEVPGFISRIRSAGYTPSVRGLLVADDIAPDDVYKALYVPPTEKLLSVKRILLASETPAVYLIDYFVPSIKQSDFNWDSFNGDMIELVSVSLGINERQMHSRLFAIIPGAEIASYLQLPADQPLINIRSTVTMPNNQALGCSLAYCNPQIIELDTVRTIRS